ncbi:peptide ABC transporter permease [Deltaproteobacteria bacterium]|nr:peptide ABC transporter permease [Deltaproteobacteria bacterium]
MSRAGGAGRYPAMFYLGLCLVGIMTALALLAPYIAPYDPTAIHVDASLKDIFQAPSWEHWMGTDALGRDVFSRMLYGARVSLWVGFVSVGLACCIGVTLGLLAGYYGGIVDEAIMRMVDIMLCFPSFFLILAVIAFLEPSLFNIMVIIGLTSWMGTARLVRAETLSLRTRDFIAAARLAEAGPTRILLLHILPNALPPVLVSATLGIAGAILTESALSFLGLGMQPPMPSWGNILLEGKQTLGIAWWLSTFPGLAILLTVLGYNLLGESLRDIFDPRLSHRHQ